MHPEAGGLAGARSRCRVCGRLGRDGVQLPLAGNSLEVVGTAVIEGDTRTDHGVLDGLRDEHLVGPSERADSSPDVNGDAAEMLADDLAFS